MPVSNLTIGHGATLELYYSGAYVQLAGITKLRVPSDKPHLIDATDMDSSGGRMEYIAGLIDSDEIQVDFNWVANNTTESTVRAIIAAGAAVSTRITTPNSTTYTFDAIVTGWEPNAPADDKMTATLSLKPTGAVTVA